MKIIVRIPNKEEYSYTELVFDSIDEYREKYPEFNEVMLRTRFQVLTREQVVRKLIKEEQEPFK